LDSHPRTQYTALANLIQMALDHDKMHRIKHLLPEQNGLECHGRCIG
jgi:hypothetical protein